MENPLDVLSRGHKRSAKLVAKRSADRGPDVVKRPGEPDEE
jgi:hypothetical protein